VPGIRASLDEARARGIPMVAVSGIIGGKALKGPADRMLASLGEEASALGVARLYAPLISHFVLDRVDASAEAQVRRLGLQALVTDTIMTDDAARTRVANEVLDFVSSATPG
jgi:LPPG:FO 2-phospho-L-lactate transferase